MNATEPEMKGLLVGLGKRSGAWVRSCAEHPHVELVGFADADPAARERFVAGGGSREQVFACLAHAMDACEAEFVLDVTPPALV